MSNNLEGIFFHDQLITSRGMRTFARKTLGDGVLQGCELSYSGFTVTVGAGFLIAAGGVLQNSAAQTVAVSGAASGYARIKAVIDLSRTATQDDFQQAFFEVDYSSTVEGFADPVQEDINNGGTVYEMTLCVAALGTAGVKSIVTMPAESLINFGGASVTKIWTNASPSSAFSAQTLTFDLSGYDAIIVGFGYTTAPSGVLILTPGIYTNGQIVGHARDNYGTYLVTRNVTVDFDTGTITFAANYINGSSDSQGRARPHVIYGIKGVQ